MVFDRRVGDHAFDLNADVCVKCGMTCEHYEDNREPLCAGVRTLTHEGNDTRKILPDSDIE
jgi:hypothetical protein